VFPDEARVDQSDELAIANGCWFETSWADHFQKTCECHFVLWEGDWHGKPFKFLDWQKCLRRLFGWARWDAEKGRAVRRFSKAALWLPKKTGKSPAGAAVGWYLFAFDGEMGAKIKSSARDGTQAKIVHTHAINMRKMSPSLFHRTRLNKSNLTISIEENFSTWELLSGDNVRSQEGLNGSVIVDEAHVVDERLERVLVDMGASRADSMWFQISTVGDNPDSYGRRDFEYGRDVAKGEIEDDSFFFLFYGLPEDTPDSKLDDPKLWEKANPGWGVTVIPSKFEVSYRRAKKKSHADFAAFKQRRLNIWQMVATPGLGDEWARRAGDVKLEWFSGGGLGVDASDSDDMTAAVFAADHDGKIIIWPMLWMTQRAIEKYSHLADLEKWAAEGFLNSVEGGSLKGEEVWQPQVNRMIESIGTKCIVADSTYCSGWLASWEDTEMVVEAVKQTGEYYSAPLADLENAVAENRIVHPGNPCLDWQFGNYLVKQYGNKRRPIKDDKKPGKKIDGVAASIMALDALRLSKRDPDCVYNDNPMVAFVS
jgi:phage terminase large subunit-like protein